MLHIQQLAPWRMMVRKLNKPFLFGFRPIFRAKLAVSFRDCSQPQSLTTESCPSAAQVAAPSVQVQLVFAIPRQWVCCFSPTFTIQWSKSYLQLQNTIDWINGKQCDIWKFHASGQAKSKGMCTFTHMAKHLWTSDMTIMAIHGHPNFKNLHCYFPRWVLCLRSVGAYAQHLQSLQCLWQQLWGIKGTPRSHAQLAGWWCF